MNFLSSLYTRAKILSLLGFPLFLACTTAEGEESQPPDPVAESEGAASEDPAALIEVPTGALEPAAFIGGEVESLLAHRKYEAAALLLEKKSVPNQEQAKYDFLLAWVWTHSNRPEKAIPYLPGVLRIEEVPGDYKQLVIGEIRKAEGKYAAAIEGLKSIEEDSPVYVRAMLQASKAARKNGSTSEGRDLLLKLAERPDPTPGGEKILMELAKGVGTGSEKAGPYLRRIWAHYPVSPEGKETKAVLKTIEGKYKQKPSVKDWADRSDALMNAWMFQTVINELGVRLPSQSNASVDACRIWYAYGRSLFKKNSVTKAIAELGKVVDNCKTLTPNLSAKSHYIIGKSHERKKEWQQAASAYEMIPKHFPEHSMADDGYALSGISHQIAENTEQALLSWKSQVESFPDGDMVAEGYWRWAWGSFLEGDTDQAIKVAEKAKSTLSLTGDPVHAFALRYWSARWKLYPKADVPAEPNPDQSRVDEALDELEELCTEHPTRFYSLLAAQRLQELAPERLAGIKRSLVGPPPGKWQVTNRTWSSEAMTRARQLAHLGLPQAAVSEFERIDPAWMLPVEKAMLTSLKAKYSPIEAHDELHKYLNAHPPGTYRENQHIVLSQAYPNKYWETISKAGKEYTYDARVFHALIREESSFNPTIVSWAGAKGLSQLMPATAKQVGGWIGIKVNSTNVFEPETNIKIGSKYLDYLHGKYRGNPFLAVAAYNAGEGNVGKWLTKTENTATDLFIESIPFRETRGYVKRVLGTYQLYRYLRQEDAIYPDWQRYNHKAKPSK
jgi:soluble lytic murein transglycosylase